MNSGATHLFGSISFFKKNDQRMFTLIARIFFIGDWTPRFWVRIGYYKFIVDSAASPRPRNFYEVGIGNGIAGEGF
jgi:hypothetical protein